MLAYLLVAFFLALLILNFYFKKEILKHYRVLYQNRVEFSLSHIFDKKRMDVEVISKYPGQKADIVAFADKIRKSLFYGGMLLLAIITVAVILKTLK